MTATIRRGLLIAAIALVPVVPGCGAPAARAARSNKPMETKPIVLGAAPVRATVALPKKASTSGRRLYLVIRGLRVDADPGVIYHVYLDLPAGAKPATNDPRHVGTINFYGVPPGSSPDRAFFSFDITDAARKLKSRKDTTVTFVPGGPAAPGAKVTIARLEVTEE